MSKPRARSSVTRLGCVGLGFLLAVLSCVRAVVPPSVPVPCPGPVVPSPPEGATFTWTFESGLDGWVQEAGDPQPTCAPVAAERLPSGVLPTLGGDYWMTGVDVGQHGNCRLDTAARSHAAARLASPVFTISQPYVALLVGGGGQPGTRVGLVLDKRKVSAPWAREAHGTGLLQMSRIVWDVRELHGKAARVVVEDTGGDGILVDDIFDSATAPPVRPPPVWGFADAHSHPMSQLGFGRNVFVGDNDGPIEKALASCAVAHGPNGDGGKAGFKIGFVEPSFNRIVGHRPTGYPDFDGWPRFSTLIHQQMYIDWIRRAWQGGLRLLVAHAVNNEELASNFSGEGDYSDKSVVKAQIAAMRDLASRHGDFMEIATTSADARRIIASGHLAVVLGVEVDAIGNCRRDSDCTQAAALEEIRAIYDQGARHVFPVHLADNAFGGSAIWADGTYDMLTWYIHDTYQSVLHDDSTAFTISFADQSLPVWVAQIAHLKNEYGKEPYAPPLDAYRRIPGGHVNSRGMTPIGVAVLREMRRLGMIVDIDHMGQVSRNDTLSLFSTLGTPVAMGHAWFRDLGYDKTETHDALKLRNDIMKTAAEVETVRGLGGIVFPITNQHDVRGVDGSGTGNDCEGTSTSWLQAYVYTVERMGGAGVGFGTDFNGFASQPMPRFGPYACTGRENTLGGPDEPRRTPGLSALETVRADADAQDAGVTYDVRLKNARANRFFGPLNIADRPYTSEERALWIAVAECRALNIVEPDKDLTAASDLVVPVASALCGLPRPGSSTWWDVARLVHDGLPAPGNVELRRRYDLVAGIVKQWARMESGNKGHPLTRSFVTPQHDFDINLDGLAEYGLLPDFLQDVANQLKVRRAEKVQDLSALFRSAEAYLEMWERVEASAGK